MKPYIRVDIHEHPLKCNTENKVFFVDEDGIERDLGGVISEMKIEMPVGDLAKLHLVINCPHIISY